MAPLQVRLTEQLKNLRAHHDELIEKVAIKCEGGRTLPDGGPQQCPELDCSLCTTTTTAETTSAPGKLQLQLNFYMLT